MQLYYREFGDPQQPPIVLLHGLFGSSMNWMGIVRQLKQEYHVIVPDLRNHGRSPHHQEMDYAAMAEDLRQLFDAIKLAPAVVVGHSMGGKCAMWMALQYPQMVAKLLIADIAPVDYDPNRFADVFAGLAAIDLTTLESRRQADELLAQRIDEESLRNYILQNLARDNETWFWRCNLSVLEAQMGRISTFDLEGHNQYQGEVLLLHGELSSYVKSKDRHLMQQLFPHMRQHMMQGTGHWVYAEQPDLFGQILKAFSEY